MTTKTVQCGICPKRCVIRPGQSGECRIRVNLDGVLRAVTYGYPCATHLDPVEKKPLFHMYPGSQIFSIATVGCNLHCKNCQNWQISQQNPETGESVHLPPERVAPAALQHQAGAIAYTYTEPLVFYEYTLDSCVHAKEAGLKNALVTAGYINKKPLTELSKHVDAANVDLKAFSDKFYQEVCDATLRPVLDSLVTLKSNGVCLEITNLLIPTMNDAEEDIRNLCKWIVNHLGGETPLHFSRFFPQFKMKHLPPTPPSTFKTARNIAEEEGLEYIYVGNIMMADAQNTYCPNCDELLIKRQRYTILENHVKQGACPKCGTEIYGLWKA